MKKLITILLTLACLASMCLTVSASAKPDFYDKDLELVEVHDGEVMKLDATHQCLYCFRVKDGVPTGSCVVITPELDRFVDYCHTSKYNYVTWAGDGKLLINRYTNTWSNDGHTVLDVDAKEASIAEMDGQVYLSINNQPYQLLEMVDPKMPFKDVSNNKWYTEPVMWAYYSGITSGVEESKFEPQGSCTRGQIVTFLWRAAGCPEPKTTNNPFTDVSADAYYYKAILWAYENGITKGTTNTTFSPEQPCTRAQIVTFIWRAKGSPKADSAKFEDVGQNSFYASAVSWAVANNITNGKTPATFAPDDTCTRAEAVTFLHRSK